LLGFPDCSRALEPYPDKVTKRGARKRPFLTDRLSPPLIKDSLIAATAIVNGLTVVTGNRNDFEKAGVTIIDPFG
jgi:predicted nucleic acid-binding protein